MATSYDFIDGNKLIYKFNLDVCCEQETPIIRVPKETEGAFVEITLTKNGTPLTLDQSITSSSPVLILHCPEIDSPTLQERTSTGTIQWSETNTPIKFSLPINEFEETILENGRHCAYVQLFLNGTGSGAIDYTSILASQMFYIDLEGFPKKKHDVNTILNIVKVSATEYGGMGYYDPNTLFIIKDTDNITIRLGNTPLIAGADGDTISKIEANGDSIERHDDRISVLEDADRPEPDPDFGQYYITVYNNTRKDITVTLTAGTGGSFSPESATVVSRAINYGEKAMGVMFTAGASSEVITLQYSDSFGTETVVYGISEFLGMRDEDEGGNATNYISFHICPDNEVLNKADYEAR
jgi:hypothetical protein